jgi:hypothetical protein
MIAEVRNNGERFSIHIVGSLEWGKGKVRKLIEMTKSSDKP